jgi:hypothetical protein
MFTTTTTTTRNDATIFDDNLDKFEDILVIKSDTVVRLYAVVVLGYLGHLGLIGSYALGHASEHSDGEVVTLQTRSSGVELLYKNTTNSKEYKVYVLLHLTLTSSTL